MKTNHKPKILRVWIERRHDDSPDTSHMGEYANRAANEYAIDRQERGDMGRHEYRYFNPSFNYVDESGKLKDGLSADEVRKYVEQDYRRMERLDAGDWSYIGVIAKAEVLLSENHLIQVLRSGGLWGVESDSGKEHMKQIVTEELYGLRAELEAAGFGTRAIYRAFQNVGTVEK